MKKLLTLLTIMVLLTCFAVNTYAVDNAELAWYTMETTDVESENAAISAKAVEVSASMSTSYYKAYNIFSWIVANCTYNYAKLAINNRGAWTGGNGALYLFNLRTGICYDYSALFAAMCRSIDIPTKFVRGYYTYNGTSVYHAWNLFWSSELNRWVYVDTTQSPKTQTIMSHQFFDFKGTTLDRYRITGIYDEY